MAERLTLEQRLRPIFQAVTERARQVAARERAMGKIKIKLDMREDNDPQGKYTGLHSVDMHIFVRGWDDRPEYDGNVTQDIKVTAVARTMEAAKKLAMSRAVAYCTDVIDAVRNYDADRAKVIEDEDSKP